MKTRESALPLRAEIMVYTGAILVMLLLFLLGVANHTFGAEGRNILFYKCPMGEKDYSRTPGKAKCGMDYVPVYEGDARGLPDELTDSAKEKGHEGHKTGQSPTLTDKARGGKILYYKCPMGMQDFSNTPGKAKCGMDYVPVYAPESKDAAKQEKQTGSDRMMEGAKETVTAERHSIHLRILTMDGLMKLPAKELEGMKMDHSKSHHIGIEIFNRETGRQVADAAVRLTVFDPSKRKINVGANPMAQHFCEDIDLSKKGIYQFEILVQKGGVQDTAWFEYLVD